MDVNVCCGGLPVAISDAEAEHTASVMKALGHPARVRLVAAIRAADGGEACVCDLQEVVDLAQPTVSHHLKVLHEVGLLDRSKRGVWVYYKARSEAMGVLRTLFSGDLAAPQSA